MQKFRKKKENYEKNENFAKNTKFSKTSFSEKVAKIHQKRQNFENTRLIFKEGFIREPN